MLGLVSPPVVEQGYSITRAERLTSSGMLVDHLNRNWKRVHYLVISNGFVEATQYQPLLLLFLYVIYCCDAALCSYLLLSIGARG